MSNEMTMFNLMKLPEYVPRFRRIRAAIFGAGAVGSYLAELLVKMGVGYLQIHDFDHFTLENAAKHSGMVRTPEDVGRSKAKTVAERAQALMIPGGKAVGIDADLRCFGPMAFAGFDILFLALDNYAAKELVNQQFLQIPVQRRSVLGMAGTSGESAVAVLLDGKEFCLRCLFDESWLESGDVRTSCSGPQYMQIEGVAEIVRTSGLASLIAAAVLAEKFRAWVLGDPNVMNTRTTYTPYPNLELLDTAPMRKRNCPDCHGFAAPGDIHLLSGSVLELTLGNALRQMGDRLGRQDFELRVHLMLFKEQSYGGFIAGEYCHHCGKPVAVYAHESRVHFEDVLCEECRASDNSAYYNADRPVGEALRCFRADTADQKLLGMTLYELGYPVGAYLYAVCRNGADRRETFCFTCMDDQKTLMKYGKL